MQATLVQTVVVINVLSFSSDALWREVTNYNEHQATENFELHSRKIWGYTLSLSEPSDHSYSVSHFKRLLNVRYSPRGDAEKLSEPL
jgi:hypothetical protein